MGYSKSNSNNRKGLKLTTGTNICKVNNYSFGLDEAGYAFMQRKQEERELLQLQKRLLQTTKHAVNISLCGYAYAEAKPKQK